MSDPSSSSPGKRRVRSPRGEGSQLRGEIVEAAAGLLDEHGTEQAVTLRAVARRVGISAPSIYGHFATREDIVLAVLTEAFEALELHLVKAARAESANPAARLQTVCRAYSDFAGSRPQRYRLMFSGLWNPSTMTLPLGDGDANNSGDGEGPVAQIPLVIGHEAFAVLVSCISDCAAAGLSSSTEPFADAAALWAGLHGLGQLANTTPLFPWPADILERMVVQLAKIDPPISHNSPPR